MHIAILVVLQALLFLSGCLYDRKDELDHPSVCGYVYEGGSDEIIRDAIVSVHFCYKPGSPSGDRLQVKTDSSGYFHLSSGNCMGNFQYELRIAKNGYDTLDAIDEQYRSGFSGDCLDHDYFLDKSD